MNYSNDTFPYKTQFNFEYNDNSLIFIKDDTVILDISKLFPFVNISNFYYTNRYLPFYQDFLFQDEIKYIIEFDKNIEVLNITDLNINIINESGLFQIMAEKMYPNTILVRAVHKASQEKINPENIEDIATIYKTIDNLNKSKIFVRVVN